MIQIPTLNSDSDGYGTQEFQLPGEMKLKLIINYRLLKFENVNVTIKPKRKYRSGDIIGEETHLIANRQHL